MNYYLCPIENKTITVKRFYLLNEGLTIDYPANVLLPFNIDERVFLLQHTEGYLLPYEFSIAKISRTTRTLLLRVSNIYQHSLPLAALALLLPEHMLRNYVQLTVQQLKGITSLMNIISAYNPTSPSAQHESPSQMTPLADQETLDENSPTVNLRLDETKTFPLRLSHTTAASFQQQRTSLDELNENLHNISMQLDKMQKAWQQGLSHTLTEGQQQRAGLDTLNNTLIHISLQFGKMQTAWLEGLSHTTIEGKAEVSQTEESDNEDTEIIVLSGNGQEEIFEESEVLDYVKDYIRQRGYYFDDETLYNYHICLKTRPFVILAGLSGTGKSKLAQLYAEALGQDETFKRLPVRPNWNDDRYLLGHLNTVTGEYVTEPAVEFILAAIANSKRLYSLCLDEMNLAHVEYYFSQFLSAMEGDRPKDRRITLMSQRAFEQCREHHRTQGKKSRHLPAEIYLPDNLIFTGTINVDETTQPISDKVIDRANTIEFFDVDLNRIPQPGDPGKALTITNRAWQSYRATQPDTRYRSQIIEINNILKQEGMGLGYRVVHEIELYLANSQGLLDPQVAFDLQCKQRILPRIHGSEVIDNMMRELIKYSQKHKLARTEQRLQEMKSRLNRDRYTSFWR